MPRFTDCLYVTWTRSRSLKERGAVARMALFGTIYCLGVPRHSNIMSSCRRALRGSCETNQVSYDFLEQHRLLDKLAGLAHVVSCDVIALREGTLAQSGATSDGTAAQLAKSVQFDDTIMTDFQDLQLEYVRVLLTCLKVACPIDLSLLSSLRHKEHGLPLASRRTRMTASIRTASGIQKRDQW